MSRLSRSLFEYIAADEVDEAAELVVRNARPPAGTAIQFEQTNKELYQCITGGL